MASIAKYDYVRFSVADFYGNSKGRVVPARHVQKFLETGPNIDGEFLTYGLNTYNPLKSSDDSKKNVFSKAFTHADLRTVHDVPWSGEPTFSVGEVICESYWLKDRSIQKACPRYVARQQLEQLEKEGLSLLSASELEFFFRKTGDVDSGSARYMSQLLFDQHSEFLFDFETQMHIAGVDLHSMHFEADANILEVVMNTSKGIKHPDMSFIFKTGILEINKQQKYEIDFLFHSDKDTKYQFSHSLWSVDHDMARFDDPDAEYNLSPLGRCWLAGLMKHARALTALWCPTANCYERLRQGKLAPALLWGTGEQSASFRVNLSELGKGTYIENRIPSGMSNPYLVLAANVAAGLDGIKKNLELPPKGQSSESLPCTLSEAIEELQADTDMVDSLGKEFVDWFVRTIRADMET